MLEIKKNRETSHTSLKNNVEQGMEVAASTEDDKSTKRTSAKKQVGEQWHLDSGGVQIVAGKMMQLLKTERPLSERGVSIMWSPPMGLGQQV